ncbi:MAG: hypothetical protein WKG32_16110, partial [Gemmatimonadaceae bacterium]
MRSVGVSPFHSLARAAAVAVAVAGVSTAGCFKQHANVEDFPSAWEATETVPIEVANHHWKDITVYVVRDGQYHRIGTATASMTTNFSLPARYLGQMGDFRLVGDPVGVSGRLSTETLVVRPGQYVNWTLESDLGRS